MLFSTSLTKAWRSPSFPVSPLTRQKFNDMRKLMRIRTRILLVYPKIPATYWGFEYALKFTYYKSVMPPLGVLTIAAMLPTHYEPKILDLNTTDISPNDIEDADMVFISAMIIQKESFNHIVQLCRKNHKTVVAGGPYATSCYKDIKDVDYFVLNEGEVTLPQFLRDLESGCPQKVYRDETKPDLAMTPTPRFDLINIDQYAFMALQYSRGCPNDCEFCDIREMFGNRVRTKKSDQFIREMECLYDMDFRGSIFVVDDNFTAARNHVKDLLKQIIKWQNDHDYPFSFCSQVSLDVAKDDELLDLLRKARFYELFIGIETPHAETLLQMRKKNNIHIDLHEAVQNIQSRGIEVMGGFILGFDTDPEDIFNSMIDFIQKAAIPQAMIGLLNALPNSTFYRRMEQEGRISSEFSGDNLSFQSNIIPVMPKQKLINGFKHVISEIYKPENYYKRVLTLIKHFPKDDVYRDYLASASQATDSIKIKTFSKHLKIRLLNLFILYKAIFNSYTFDVAIFLMKALRYNYKYFNYAIRMTVRGYHFIKLTETIVASEPEMDEQGEKEE